MRPGRWRLALVVLGVVTGGCNDSSLVVTESTLVSVTTSPAPASPGEPAPQDVLDSAVSRAVEAGSYAFTGSLSLTVDGGVVESIVEGWVDGRDRMLTVSLGDRRQTTSVLDGVATVQRDGQSREISLTDAGAPPSIELLGSVESLQRPGPGLLTGTIPASTLTDSGFDVPGVARVVIRLAEDGGLVGYDLFATDLTWSASVEFSGFGEAFSG